MLLPNRFRLVISSTRLCRIARPIIVSTSYNVAVQDKIYPRLVTSPLPPRQTHCSSSVHRQKACQQASRGILPAAEGPRDAAQDDVQSRQCRRACDADRWCGKTTPLQTLNPRSHVRHVLASLNTPPGSLPHIQGTCDARILEWLGFLATSRSVNGSFAGYFAALFLFFFFHVILLGHYGL